MARAPFVFFKRGYRVYVQFWNDGKAGYGTARSTGMVTENEALKVVMEWMKAEGPLLARRSIKKKSGFQMTACGYLSDFWKAARSIQISSQRSEVSMYFSSIP